MQKIFNVIIGITAICFISCAPEELITRNFSMENTTKYEIEIDWFYKGNKTKSFHEYGRFQFYKEEFVVHEERFCK